MRTCTKCGETKSLSEFSGKYPSCRACKAAYLRARRTADPQASREAVRAYYATKADEINERRRARRAENPEKYRAARREAYYRNREAELEARKRYVSRASRAVPRNPTTLAPSKRYRESHPEVRTIANQNRRARVGGKTISQVELATLDDSRCALCGDGIDLAFTWPHPLSRSLDHVIPLAAGGEHSIENVQWAHLLCNMRKGDRAS